MNKKTKSKLKNISKITKEYDRKGQDSTIFDELSRISTIVCKNLWKNT